MGFGCRVLACGSVPGEALELLSGHAHVDISSGQSCEMVSKMVAPYQAIIVGTGAAIDESVLGEARELRVIACVGQSLNAVDTEAATRCGVVIVSSPGSVASAAELTLGCSWLSRAEYRRR